MVVNKDKFSKKVERVAVVNNGLAKILGLLGNHEVMDVFKHIKELQDYYETQYSKLKKELSDLRKKMYSLDFLKKRIKKLYPEDQKFTQFILNLTEG